MSVAKKGILGFLVYCLLWFGCLFWFLWAIIVGIKTRDMNFAQLWSYRLGALIWAIGLFNYVSDIFAK